MIDMRKQGINIRVGEDEYMELREIKASSLPAELQQWFDTAKEVMRLPDIVVHYIRNETVKQMPAGITYVGGLGSAYLDDKLFAFIESDMGIEMDKNTIIHELLHFRWGSHCGNNSKTFIPEVDRLMEVVKEKILSDVEELFK